MPLARRGRIGRFMIPSYCKPLASEREAFAITTIENIMLRKLKLSASSLK